MVSVVRTGRRRRAAAKGGLNAWRGVRTLDTRFRRQSGGWLSIELKCKMAFIHAICIVRLSQNINKKHYSRRVAWWPRPYSISSTPPPQPVLEGTV